MSIKQIYAQITEILFDTFTQTHNQHSNTRGLFGFCEKNFSDIFPSSVKRCSREERFHSGRKINCRFVFFYYGVIPLDRLHSNEFLQFFVCLFDKMIYCRNGLRCRTIFNHFSDWLIDDNWWVWASNEIQSTFIHSQWFFLYILWRYLDFSISMERKQKTIKKTTELRTITHKNTLFVLTLTLTTAIVPTFNTSQVFSSLKRFSYAT